MSQLPGHSFNSGNDVVLQQSLIRKIQREHVVLKDDISLPSSYAEVDLEAPIDWLIRKVFRFKSSGVDNDNFVSPDQAVDFAVKRGCKCFTEMTMFQLLASYEQPVFSGITLFPLEVDSSEDRLIYQVDGVKDVSLIRMGKNIPHGSSVTWAFMA